jgi:hypothetical protein
MSVFYTVVKTIASSILFLAGLSKNTSNPILNLRMRLSGSELSPVLSLLYWSDLMVMRASYSFPLAVTTLHLKLASSALFKDEAAFSGTGAGVGWSNLRVL